MTVVAVNIAAHRLGQCLGSHNGSRQFSGQTLVLRVSGNVDNLINSDTCMCLMFFCFFLCLGGP